MTSTDLDSSIWKDEIRRNNKINIGNLFADAASTFWEEKVLFDYTIKVEEEEFQVHKFVIAAASDFFKTMLSGSLKESQENFVELKGVSKDGFEPILNHIYTNSPLDLTKDNVIDTLSAASILQINFIMDDCVRFIGDLVDKDNCVDVLNLTFMYPLKRKEINLERLAVENIVVHLDQLRLDKELVRLSADALKCIVSQNWIERSELFLLDIIKEWVNFEKDTVEVRMKQVCSFIDEVRFGLIRPKDLKQIRTEYPFLTQPKCSILVEEALRYYDMPVHKQVLSQTRQTTVRDDATVVAFGGFFYTEQNDEESRQSTSMYALGEGWDEVNSFSLPKQCQFRQAAVAVVNNFLIVCGGLKDNLSGSSTTKCHLFDPRICRWSRIASMCIPRANFALVAHNEQLYAFGGEQRHVYTNICERYSFVQDKWESLPERMEKGLSSPGACAFDEQIYVLGGKYRDPNGQLKLSKDVFILDPVKGEWANRPSMKSAQAGHAVLAMYGRNAITPRIWTPEKCLSVVAKNGQNLDSFFPDCCSWQRLRLRDRPPSSASVVTVGNVVYFVNGWVPGKNGERVYGACAEYDPIGGTDSFGYPSNKGFAPLPKYPEEVDGMMCCVLAPNFYLKDSIRGPGENVE